MSTIAANLKALEIEIENARAEFQSKVTKMIASATSDLFKTYPQIEAMSWVQYTPAWNDGEPCEFSVCDPTFAIAGVGEDEDEDEDEDEEGLELYQIRCEQLLPEDAIHDCDSISTFLNSVGHLLESIYGTNQRITIYADGTEEIEEYDCGY